MKPLYILAAEERLKGQPPRHAKVYKDDISVFEADMLYVRNYLLSNKERSLGKISKGTGIPKSTLRKMLSPYGIKRTYTLPQLERMRVRNIKRYLKVITQHSGIIKENGKWKGLEYRDSDRERFKAWLMENGYMLVKENMKYFVVKYPEDVKEELAAKYAHRRWAPIEF